ncbi:MAG: XRE family transcriptional regulator [Spirochaetaceae bacterium]|jgi:quercetin dioxygenase-like cupin family protein/DNA-binding XRE family transcriptional regulator|nr:XRE family transcriptional regulator [Spirochaetaceae bacterium]
MPKTHHPGDRIAELRKTYSISRETLAERSGLDIELIRRIEEDGHIPDLAPLIKISRALGVRIGVLMDDHEELGPVITRSGEAGKTPRFVTGLPGEAAPSAGADPHSRQGLSFHALAADKGGRHMEPFIVDIEKDANQDKSTHEGEEFIYVLAGKLSLEYGKNTHILESGDSVYYDSIVPHRVLAAGNAAARILAVVYTPV